MASGRTGKGNPGKGARNVVGAARSSAISGKQRPWGTIIAVLVILVLAIGVFGYSYIQISTKNAHDAELQRWNPSDTNKDPSTAISGVVVKSYPSGQHVSSAQRVAYDQSPPFGGPHDQFWADCDGIVYPTAVRNENMVHALEHGTVWIAYNPDKVQGSDLDTLKKKVTGQQFMMLSPYPGLDKSVSLQSWGHQLKVDSVNDPRIDEFIQALRRNQFTYPEVGASCDALGPGEFDPNNPPPFDPSKPGPDAIPMTGAGSQNAVQQEINGGQQTSAPTTTAAGK